MLCVGCWEGPVSHGRQMPTSEADLALSLLYVSQVLLHPVLGCIVFLGDSNTKIQWAEVLRLLLVIVGNR